MASRLPVKDLKKKNQLIWFATWIAFYILVSRFCIPFLSTSLVSHFSPGSLATTTGMTSPSPPPPLTTPEEAWFTLSVVLAVVGIFQWGSALHSKVVRRREHPDEESTHTSTRPYASGGWSLARLPLAAVNIFRVVAFRWTIELGTYDLKVADIFLTLAYVAFLLVSTRGGESAN
jgi:hypothetical protein